MCLPVEQNLLNSYQETIENLNKKIEKDDEIKSTLLKELEELKQTNAEMKNFIEKKSPIKSEIMKDLAFEKQRIRNAACKVNRENKDILYENSLLDQKIFDLIKQNKILTKKEIEDDLSIKSLSKLINEKDKHIGYMTGKLKKKNEKIEKLKKNQKVSLRKKLDKLEESILLFFSGIFTCKSCVDNCIEDL